MSDWNIPKQYLDQSREIKRLEARVAELESALRNIEGLAESKYIASVAKQALKGQDEYITLSKRDFDKLVDGITSKSE